jgi:hypothetical protein
LAAGAKRAQDHAMIRTSRTVGAGESAVHLSLCNDSGYRFIRLSADYDGETGEITIELAHVDELVRELLALKTLGDVS